jgi:hypothetical protein
MSPSDDSWLKKARRGLSRIVKPFRRGFTARDILVGIPPVSWQWREEHHYDKGWR